MNKHFLNKRLAHQIGVAGLVPFCLLAIASWVVNVEWLETFATTQMVYSVITLSFLGGIHWGATMASPDLSARQTKRALLWSVAPTLIAFLSTTVHNYHLAFIAAGFIVTYHVDKHLYQWYKLPDWFIRLRLILTCVVVAALVLTLFGANLRAPN
ncbi:MAG: DUF3429 domain-containing protein [Burkholderiaceae bacterium]|nr:DUF3429 domain-containing protein [Burkholderiaceae bacterium]